MTLFQFIFYFFITLALAAVVGIFLTKNIFKAALYLLMCLLCVAALYVLHSADFVAVTQILIYAGGVVVVIIFGIMLTSKISGKPLLITNTNIFSGSLVSFALLALLTNVVSDNFQSPALREFDTENSIETIGLNFMTSHLLAFEVAGVLLLISLVGAAVISSYMKSRKT